MSVAAVDENGTFFDIATNVPIDVSVKTRRNQAAVNKATVVEPVDPDERRVLDVVDVAPRAAAPDDLGLVQTVDGLGERVVVRVADATDRALEARSGETLGIANGRVLGAAVALMDDLSLRGRVCSACSSASRARPLRRERDTRQPTPAPGQALGVVPSGPARRARLTARSYADAARSTRMRPSRDRIS